MWMKPTIKPKLTIQGEWFEKAGFNIGDKIELQVINDQIIIQKV
jgi:antitoxin component of MazEF toxin-antitoxin module